MMAMDGMWGWGMGFGWILPLLLIGLLIWAFAIMRERAPAATTPSAKEILKERYARGEIDRDTYTRMRKELE